MIFTLPELTAALNRYAGFRGMAMADVLLRQGGNLAFHLAQKLRALAPAKGSIRSARLSDLKSGVGVKVRQKVYEAVFKKHKIVGAFGSYKFRKARKLVGVKGLYKNQFSKTKTVKGKKLNAQALAVQAELNIRERGRGFLSVSSKFPRKLPRSAVTTSKFSDQTLAESNLSLEAHGGTLRIAWTGGTDQGELAAIGLTKAGQKAIEAALRETSSDINNFIDGEIAKEIQTQTGLELTKRLNPGIKL